MLSHLVYFNAPGFPLTYYTLKPRYALGFLMFIGAKGFSFINEIGIDSRWRRKMMKKRNLLKLIILALLGTISLVLFFFNFPLPFLPPYLKIDFSDIPALMASLIFSPMA